MTVEVETPEGLRSGSSVIEVYTRAGVAFPGPEAATMHSRVRGEAVTINLGHRGMLFALLRRADREQGGSGYAWALLPTAPQDRRNAEAVRRNYRALLSVQGEAELPPARFPMLVRFRDMADPATVEQIKPERLSYAFGSGVRLRRIAVEITGDPVTTGIADVLKWLPQYYNKRLSGARFGNPGSPNVAEILSAGAFSTEAPE